MASCYYCSCPGDNITSDNPLYGLEIDTVATDIGLLSDGTDLSGYSTYRLYVTTPNADDYLSSVSGDANNPLHLSTTTTFYQNTDFGGETANGINPLLFATYPSLAYDSVGSRLVWIRSLISLAGEAVVNVLESLSARLDSSHSSPGWA